jgi:Pup-like protein
MSKRQDRPNRSTEEHSNEQPAIEEPPDRSGSVAATAASSQADTVLDDIDDLLDDIDRSIYATLGFQPGEVVDPAEVARRADTMNSQYIQKGGQ